VEKVVEGLDPGDFVIIAAPDDVEEPFYLAQVQCVCYIRVTVAGVHAVLFYCSKHCQVVANDFHNDKITVHWYKPTARSQERHTIKYHQHSFEEENEHITSRNRQGGGMRIRLQPRIQELEYNVIHFGFNKLTKTKCLPAEVLRQLRQLGLMNDRVRRR
jgi:hypothetical protein